MDTYKSKTCRANKYQFIAHFDQSVQHNKKGSDSLVAVASRMGLRWGGTQPKLRDAKVCPGDLGSYDHPATMYKKDGKWVEASARGAVPVSLRLSEGDTISSK